MTPAELLAFLPDDLGFVFLFSVVSLVAVWVPLYRGLRIALQARAATRKVPAGEMGRALARIPRAQVEPLALLMLRVLRRSLRDHDADEHPGEFILDATRQYVVNEYEANYSIPISMYANLLPPIGFIGTTCGMMILLMSMRTSDGSLELGALALALTSSIFALIGFALLESLKIRLHGRLLRCLAEVATLYHGQPERRKPAPPAAVASPVAP